MDRPPRDLLPRLAASVKALRAGEDAIGEGRRRELAELARFVRSRRAAGEAAKLVFICTHNSRRSHLAQIWAQTAAHVHDLSGVETYSGGTEATAFNPRAVAALERAGFEVARRGGGDNPVYEVRFAPEVAPMACFSKVYDRPPNPPNGYCAVMTCSAADEGCPVVFGAAERLAIRYDDPKSSDGSPAERQTYDERCRQIGREMLWALGAAAEAR